MEYLSNILEFIQDWANRNEGFLALLEILFLGVFLGIFWKGLHLLKNKPKIVIEATVRRYSNVEKTRDAYRLTIHLSNSGKSTKSIEVIRFLNLPSDKVNKDRLVSLFIEKNYLKTQRIGDLKPHSSDIREHMAHFYEGEAVPKKILCEVLGEGYYDKIKVIPIEPSDNLYICNFCGQLTAHAAEGQCEHCNADLS